MFEKIGRLAATRPKTVLILWIIILVASAFFSPKVTSQLKAEAFSIPGSESADAKQYIQDHFANMYPQKVILVVQNNKLETTDSAFKDMVTQLEDKVKKDGKVIKTESPFSSERTELMQPTAHRAYIEVDLDCDDSDALKFVDQLRTELKDDEQVHKGATVQVTGSPGINADINAVSQENVAKVEEIGLPIVFVLLLFVFRSVVAAMLPLLVGLFSINVTMAIIYMIASRFELSVMLSNVVTMLGLGVAIDYALFITQRFREELHKGSDVQTAIQRAVNTSGRSVFFAGLTVAASLVSLFVPNTSLFRSIAIGGFVVLFVAILAALTLLPAVLTLLGKRVDAWRLPFRKQTANHAGGNTFWGRISDMMLRRPVLFLVVGIALIACLTPPSKDVRMHIPVAAFDELPSDAESRVGMEAMVDHFGLGKSFPVEVLLEKTNGSVLDRDALSAIDTLSNKIKTMQGVDEVLSLTTLNKDATLEQTQALFSQYDKLPDSSKNGMKQFLSTDKQSTILYVVPKESPSSETTHQLVKSLRDDTLAQPGNGFTARVTGETALGVDFDDKIVGSIPMIITIILCLTYLLLHIAFRSTLLPLKAILFNGLVTLGSLGFLVYMYQNGHMPDTRSEALNVSTPIMLFAILFGLSIDYEVIIVSRIKEAMDETGDHVTSIKEGFVSTAGMINGAASIMIVVFGVFLFAQFRFVQELGVGLALAILMDALIVRTFLVPTSMKLLGRLCWWTPWARSNPNRKPSKSFH